ncbi:MAG: DUF732 domain-containing protein [Acidimicrobiales bacterium]
MGTALVLLLAGCHPSSGGGASAVEGAFLSQVHGRAPDIGSYRSDGALVELGHAVCDDLTSGASAQQVADRIETVSAGNPLPSTDLGAVMAAAGDLLCPRYAPVVGSAGPG